MYVYVALNLWHLMNLYNTGTHRLEHRARRSSFVDSLGQPVRPGRRCEGSRDEGSEHPQGRSVTLRGDEPRGGDEPRQDERQDDEHQAPLARRWSHGRALSASTLPT